MDLSSRVGFPVGGQKGSGFLFFGKEWSWERPEEALFETSDQNRRGR